MIRYLIIGAIVLVVLMLCLFFAIANFAGENYFEHLDKMQKIGNSRHYSTSEFVQEINETYFSSRLKIAKCKKYDDHYSRGIVSLSDETMESNSLASLATIAHEVGHAKQDFGGNHLQKLFKLRRIGKVFGFFVMPLLLAGAVLCALNLFDVFEEEFYLYIGFGLVGLGLFTFLFVLYEKIQEIKIEKEASTFAVKFLQEYFSDEEVGLCKEFLDSARLTYWSDFFKTLLSWTFLTKRNKSVD